MDQRDLWLAIGKKRTLCSLAVGVAYRLILVSALALAAKFYNKSL